MVSCDDESPIDGPVGANYVKPQVQRQQFDRQCTRTVQLLNLAEGTTHVDITKAVRGGMLLDVFLRGHERSATVSFLHAADARRFYEHVRRHDLYIKNKRVIWALCHLLHVLLTTETGRYQVERSSVHPPWSCCWQGGCWCQP